MNISDYLEEALGKIIDLRNKSAEQYLNLPSVDAIIIPHSPIELRMVLNAARKKAEVDAYNRTISVLMLTIRDLEMSDKLYIKENPLLMEVIHGIRRRPKP